MKFVSWLFLLLGLGLAGCASYRVETEPGGRNIRALKKIWVKTNYDDNHAMSVHIAEGLRVQGFEVGAGPLTMMPRDSQAIVEYRDAWAWDFRTHLVGLQLSFMEPKEHRLLAIARYSDPASLFNDPSDVVHALLQELLTGKHTKVTESSEGVR